MNVVVIVLDTLRRDHLGCYGYGKRTSPSIDRLAEQGVRFERCYATDVPTIPSFTALLSGQLGTRTGRVSFNATELVPLSVKWMPTLIGESDRVTCAVTTLYHMGDYFSRGFQHYLNPMACARHRTQTVDADEINAFALPWLERHRKEDFFMFVHYWDPHVESVWKPGPAPVPRYKAPEDYRGMFYDGEPEDPAGRDYVISQYDANIAFADKHIGDLLDKLEQLGIADETMVVFITDHGENLGEDHPEGTDLWDHLDVYEPVIRIPLIIRHPELKGGRAVDAMVQNVDVAPTILNALGVDVPDEFDGRDLMPLMSGETDRSYAEAFCDTGFFTVKRAIVTDDGLKFIRTFDNGPYKDAPVRELFDLNDDPGEVENLAEAQADRADELETRMMKWVDAKLGKRPDPLRLRAHMGSSGPLSPYYGYAFVPFVRKETITAKHDE